jgi:uncharacterized repeat protein (TIGR01451 family)
VCFGDSLGSAVITPVSSPDPYWLTVNGNTSQFYTTDSLSGLSAGSYSYLVTDSVSGCSDTGTFVIAGPSAPLTATATSTTVCTGGMGWATVTASGGTPPYTFLWSNGSTSPVQQGLWPGVYLITVSDANGCTTTTNATITPFPPVTLTFSVVPASCNTCNDGIIVATAGGGSPPYTYSWNSSTTGGTNTLSGLVPGLYQCCVSDANGCFTCDSVACLGPGFQQVSGCVFYDYNGNGLRDSGEAAATNRRILLMPDSLTALSSTPSGYYSFYLTNGLYTDSLIPSAGWHTTTPAVYPLNLTGSNITGLDFGLYPDQVNAGFATGCLFPPAPRCLSQRTYSLRIRNEGWGPASGIASLTIDPQMTLISLSPAADSVTGNTYYWHFDSLLSGTDTYRYLTALLPAAGSVLQLSNRVMTYDSSGTAVQTSSDSLIQTVLCSYDPNDKSVNPPGTIIAPGALTSQLVAMDTPLDYVIRFQNTGNDTAYTVVIRDTIDQGMDLLSLELDGASHPFTAGLDRNRVLTLTFENILLPDSNTDEPGSHGFVQYSIRPATGMPFSTTVSNTANIYFDANAPVITNTTLTLYDAIAVIEDPPYSVPTYNEFFLLPNPADGMFLVTFKDTQNGIHRVSVVNLLGETVRDLGKVSGSSVPVSRDGLPSGIYFVRVDDAVKKLVLR